LREQHAMAAFVVMVTEPAAVTDALLQVAAR
jgi:hypothetical protein